MAAICYLLVFLQVIVITSAKDMEPSSPEVCAPSQYFRLGDTGVIECEFENFYSVYWYNSTDSQHENPLVALKDSLKTGDGYNSGEFDVFLNGSFIIRTVSLQNDHFFRVIMLKNKNGDDFLIRDIRVNVVVPSQQPYPYIEICGEESFCFAKLGENYKLTCSVNGTLPAANLTWLIRNNKGYQELTSEDVTFQRNNLYSAESKTTTRFKESQSAVLLVCKVFGPPHVVSTPESMVFIENIDKQYTPFSKRNKGAQIGTKLALFCSSTNTNFIIWKKESESATWKSIATIVFEEEAVYSKIYENKYGCDENGSLIIPQVGFDDGGFFMCIYSSSGVETVQAFEVVLFALPDPPYVIVEGCAHGQRCVLELKTEGNLTCSVKGIRPSVRLDWLPFPEEYTTQISFFNRQEVVVVKGDTYDISVTSSYKLKDVDQAKLAAECRVSDWDHTILELDTIVELQLERSDEHIKGRTSGLLVALIVVVVIVVLILVIATLLRRKTGTKTQGTKTQSGQEQEDDEQMKELMPKNREIEEGTRETNPNSTPINVGRTVSQEVAYKEREGTTQDNPSESVGRLHMDSPDIKRASVETEGTTQDNPSESVGSLLMDSPEIKKASVETEGTTQENPSESVGRLLMDSPEIKKASVDTEGTTQENPSESVGRLLMDSADIKRASVETDNKKDFEKRLKSKYKEFYTVFAVPCQSSEKCSVNDVFLQRRFDILPFEEYEGQEVNSHHKLLECAFNDSLSRLILIGKRGSGKLTLIRQLAYEWCEEQENSPMKSYETFIFIDFRYMQSDFSLTKAVKDFIADSPLTEDDISRIISNYRSGLIILYGFDDLLDYDEEVESDFNRLMSSEIYRNFQVIITAVDQDQIPDAIDSEARKVLLKELEVGVQIEYVKKHARHNVSTQRIETFECNPLLQKLCKIPVFLALYVNAKSTPTSATKVLKSLMAKRKKHKKGDQTLAKMACEWLMSSDVKEHFIVSAMQLDSSLEQKDIKQYKETGLLVEARGSFGKEKSASSLEEQSFTFCNNVILDWYAAYHFQTLGADKFQISLEKIDQHAFENVFCFICGIQPDKFGCVIDVLEKTGKFEPELTMLCLLEQQQNGGKLESVDCIKNLFERGIVFNLQDTHSYQLSVVQVLLLKNVRSILKTECIDTLIINECLSNSGHCEQYLSLQSGVKVPTLPFVKSLEFNLPCQILEDIRGLFQYAASCEILGTLDFQYCFLPENFEKGDIPETFSEKQVKVTWNSFVRGGPLILQLSEGKWQDKFNATLSTEEYANRKQTFMTTEFQKKIRRRSNRGR